MYSCGPTVYAPPTWATSAASSSPTCSGATSRGRATTVTWVMNITDVDDRIIRDAQAEGVGIGRADGPTHRSVSRGHAAAAHRPRPMSCPVPLSTSPRWWRSSATLVDAGHAYRTDDGSIFFRIASWPAYGRLAHVDPAQQRVGERVEADDYSKDDVRDFALWKGPRDGEPSWETAIGAGPTRLAHRVLGDEHEIPGPELRHPHRRRGPGLPPPRGRDRTVGSRHRPAVRAYLAALRPPPDGRREDGQASRQHRPAVRALCRGRLARGRCATPCWRSTTERRWSSRPTSLAAAAAAVDRLATALAALDAYREERPDDATISAPCSTVLATAFDAGLDDDLNISVALAAVFDLVRELNRRSSSAPLSTADAAHAAAARCATWTGCSPWRKMTDWSCRRVWPQLLEARRCAREPRLGALGHAARRAGRARHPGRGHARRPALAREPRRWSMAEDDGRRRGPRSSDDRHREDAAPQASAASRRSTSEGVRASTATARAPRAGPVPGPAIDRLRAARTAKIAGRPAGRGRPPSAGDAQRWIDRRTRLTRDGPAAGRGRRRPAARDRGARGHHRPQERRSGTTDRGRRPPSTATRGGSADRAERRLRGRGDRPTTSAAYGRPPGAPGRSASRIPRPAPSGPVARPTRGPQRRLRSPRPYGPAAARDRIDRAGRIDRRPGPARPPRAAFAGHRVAPASPRMPEDKRSSWPVAGRSRRHSPRAARHPFAGRARAAAGARGSSCCTPRPCASRWSRWRAER